MSPQDRNTPEQQSQESGSSQVTPGTISPLETTPAPSGRRQAFLDIRRQLTNEDLSSPGVQKMLLDDLDRAESECEMLHGYVERFHEADKKAAILEEKNLGIKALEIMFGVGVGLGGTIMGLAPLFWEDQPNGWIALIVGFLLIVGASIARVVKK